MTYKVAFSIGDYPICEIVSASSFMEAIWLVRRNWVNATIHHIVRGPVQ